MTRYAPSSGSCPGSRPLADIREQSKAFIAALVDTARDDRSRLEAAVATLLECSSVQPTTLEIVAHAFALEKEIALSSQDATVYATILHHLRTAGDEPKVFATQNTSDLLSPIRRYGRVLHGTQH